MSTAVLPAAFREPYALTWRLLEIRARRYRNLIIGVLAVIFASVVWSAFLTSLLPFLCWLSLPCLSGLFFSIDALSVNRWRVQILAFWLEGRLDIDDFRYALTSMKHLPTKTIAGLLGSLPTKATIGVPVAASPPLPQAMALTLTCIHSCVAARSFAATAAWIVGTTSVATAIITGSWMPCLGALLVFPALGAGPVWRLLQFRRWRMELRALFADEARLQSFVSLAARLDWESISQCRKDALLRSLVAGPANVEALNPVRAPG